MNETTEVVALLIVELAIGIVLGFAAWSYVAPALVAANAPTA